MNTSCNVPLINKSALNAKTSYIIYDPNVHEATKYFYEKKGFVIKGIKCIPWLMMAIIMICENTNI